MIIKPLTLNLRVALHKPGERLKEGDKYRTKPEVPDSMMRLIY
ncbi:MAG: hypothetical protein ACFB02_08050 [Mastigocoleus sp.]